MTLDKVEALVDAYLAELPEAARAGPTARADARFAVDRILFMVDVERRTGGLASVNAAYREGRASGVIKVSYAAHLEALTMEEVRKAARTTATAP
jgi:hypothetical protein